MRAHGAVIRGLVFLLAVGLVSLVAIASTEPIRAGATTAPAVGPVVPAVEGLASGSTPAPSAASATTPSFGVADPNDRLSSDEQSRLDVRQAALASPAPTVRPSAPSSRAPRAKRVLAAFLGDSYTTGWAGSGLGRAGWPSIVSAALGWRSKNFAVAGTGFVNPGWTQQPMRTRVAAVIRLHPRVVIVAGGHNDRRFGSRATARAADAVIDRLRAGLPHATIVIIGPIWANGSPPASIVGIDRHLRARAAAVGAIFIDPLKAGWFSGRAHRFIGPDGIHPTNAGHRRIAAEVIAALRTRAARALLP